MGDHALLAGRPLVAVVGTRVASPYGVRITRAIATALANAGATVLSGMARGVDAEAHRSALAAHSPTIAVLGTGADVPYPAAHRALHQELSQAGLVISESEPGTRAFPGCFPRRNRIIAALADLVIVTEAGFKSGAINTATQALELGRVVAAVPGPIDQATSAGTNLLIRDGAQVITSIDDAVQLAGLRPAAAIDSHNLAEDEIDLLTLVQRSPISVEQVAAALGVDLRECLNLVTRLELAGVLEEGPDGILRPSSAVMAGM